MSVTIQTVITNKSRGVRSLIISRSKTYSLRAGETVVLDYDIWSYLTPTVKRKLEHDVQMGRLEITTRLFTDNANISVDPDGTYRIANGGLEVAKPKEQVKENKLPTAKADKATASGKLFDNSGTVMADQSSSVMQKALGAKRVDTGNTDQTEQPEQDKTGFTKTDMSSSGLMHTTNNLEPAHSSSVFKATPADTPKAEEEVKAEPEKELSRSEYIDELYAAKDYTAIAGALTEWYPGTTFTKASIKKCNSYAELKEKYPVLE
jgi:hypothetical protein